MWGGLLPLGGVRFRSVYIYEVESAEVGLEPDLVGVDGLLLLFVAPPGESVVHDALKYLAHHRHEDDE